MSNNNEMLQAALNYHRLDFTFIPLKPGEKRSRHRWNDWLKGLSEDKIIKHFEKYPNDGIACIPGDSLVVFDADSPESLAKLYEIEEACDCHPSLIAKTKKGEHHYFRIPEGITVKQRSFGTEAHPERIDVKTGRSLVEMPPSGGKEWELMEALSED